MSSVTIHGVIGGNTHTLNLDVKYHLHNRVETFRYERNVGPSSVPLDFLKLHELDSRKNVKIIDKRYLLPENDSDAQYGITKIFSKSHASQYKDILATNYSYVDNNGVETPMFYAHRLDEGVTSAQVRHYVEGNVFHQHDIKVVVDIENQRILVSEGNQYDLDRNSYHIMWVRSTNADGTVKNVLLNAEPVAQEGTWEDIDLETGLLKDDYPIWTRTFEGGLYKFTFSQAGPYWIMPLDTGMIRALPPSHHEPDAPWYLRFTAGDVTINSDRYYLPEHAAQAFIPSIPYLYVPDEKLSFLSRSYLTTGNKKLHVDAEANAYLELRIYDVDGTLFAVYTTDTDLEGTNYSDTDIKYDSTKIDTWSEESGIIHVKGKIDPSWTVRASYYYESVDYQLTELDINPVLNSETRNHFYVFYVIPNHPTQGLYYLKVDETGIIKEVSNPLEDIIVGGTFNTNTSVGERYWDENNINTWYKTYVIDGNYMLVAEAFADIHNIHLIHNRIDVRREPSFVNPSEVFAKQPKLLNSRFGYSEEGAPVATDGSVFVEVPLSVLEAYGGHLTAEDVQSRCNRLTRAGTATIVDYWYPKTEVTATNTVSGQVDLSFLWVGAFTYRVYRKDALGLFNLIHTVTPGSRATMNHSDSGLTVNEIAHYSVRVVEGTVEYPGVEVALKVT